MNWIDDKYRDRLKEQQFSIELRKKGWSDMEKVLDKQMPASGFSPKRHKGLWFSLIVALFFTGSVIGWWFFTVDNSKKEEKFTAPEDIQTERDIERRPESKDYSDQGREEVAIPSGKTDHPLVNRDKVPGESKDANDIPPSAGNTERKKDELDALSGKTQKAANTEDIAVSNSNSPVADVSEDKVQPGKGASQSNIRDKSSDDSNVKEAAAPPDAPPDEQISALFRNEKVLNTDNIDLSLNPAIVVGPQSEGNSPENHTSAQESKIFEKNTKEEQSDTTNAERKFEHISPALPKKPEIAKTNRTYRHLAFKDVENDLPEKDLFFFSRERFSLSLWSGYTYTDKFIDTDNVPYKQAREEEQAIWTLSVGFNMDYFLNRHWTFGIGIGSAEYGEILNYSFKHRDTVHYDGRYGPPRKFNDIISKDSVRIIDSINVGHWNYTVIDEYNDTALNSNNGRTRWQYIEIPVTFGYRFGTGRFRPWLRTGIALGIPISTAYRYIDAELKGLTVLPASDGRQGVIQYSYLLNFGVDCYISRRISIRANALGSMQLRSGLSQDYAEQRYYRLGASIEVAYNF